MIHYKIIFYCFGAFVEGDVGGFRDASSMLCSGGHAMQSGQCKIRSSSLPLLPFMSE